MAEHVCEKLRDAGVKTESLRMVDYAILPGVERNIRLINDVAISVTVSPTT
jgi:hypothetical protein